MSARGTTAWGACVAWCLACAPFALSESTFGGVSRTALAALPWIAYAGLPRAPAQGRERIVAALAFEVALFLPPVALGAWIDLAFGSPTRGVATIAGASLVLGCLLALAARLSERTAGARQAFAGAWFFAVALGPFLAGALCLGGAPRFGPAPPWLSFAAHASPLGWLLAALDARELAPALPWAALAAVLVLFAVVVLCARSNSKAART